jgi:uncharacterized protein (TIGR02145 family)
MMAGKKAKEVKYGPLYNWYATQGTGNNSITSSDDWAVGDYTKWQTLFTNHSYNALNLRTPDLLYWDNNSGINLFHFNSRGAGFREADGVFSSLKITAFYWTSTNWDSTRAWMDGWTVSNPTTIFELGAIDKRRGVSIRLFRQATIDEQMYIPNGAPCTPYTGNDRLLQYPTIRVGTQVWTACNLAETKLRNGSLIPNITDNATWAGMTTIAMCDINNNPNNTYM